MCIKNELPFEENIKTLQKRKHTLVVEDNDSRQILFSIKDEGGQTLCSLEIGVLDRHPHIYKEQNAFCERKWRGIGYGSSLYMIALIYLSSKGIWFKNDYRTTTSSAKRIWQYWLKNSPNHIETLQLQDKETPQNIGFLIGRNTSFYVDAQKKDLMSQANPKVFWENPQALEIYLDHPFTKAYKLKHWQKYYPFVSDLFSLSATFPCDHTLNNLH